MSKIKKISIVALVLLLFGIVGCIFTFKTMIQEDPLFEENVINESFNDIEITTDNTKVEILPTTDSKAKVEISGEVRKGANYHLSSEVENSTLSINVKHELRGFVNFFPSTLSLKVYIPEKVYESLQIKGENGLISVSDIQAKDIHLNTDNGKTEFRNVRGITIETETDNGSSNLYNVKASTIKVQSDNGKIILEDIDGHISAKASNGSISYLTDHLDQPIEFETENGRIHIQTKEKPTNATINTSVENGKVNIFDSSGRNTVFGNGENSINLTSSNGNIIVEKK